MSVDQAIELQRVRPSRRRRALSVLLLGREAASDPAVDQFQAYATREQLSMDGFWEARRGEETVAAALAVPCAGRTGMVFASPPDGDEHVPLVGELIGRLVDEVEPRHMALLQSLLDEDQELMIRTYRTGGFERLAVLVYMEREADLPMAPLALPPPFRAVNWQRRHRELFKRGILASYEQTLDCPGLLGRRDIDDILAGHMATGRFEADLWTCLLAEDEPVGVMLLNVIPPREALELVYLGLAPRARGHGLARRLMLHGLSQVRRRHCRRMLLAVDERNEPAVRLYGELGFHPTTRKLAMIRSVGTE